MILVFKGKKFLEKIFRFGILFIVCDFLEYLYIISYFNIKYLGRVVYCIFKYKFYLIFSVNFYFKSIVFYFICKNRFLLREIYREVYKGIFFLNYRLYFYW